MNQPTQTPAHPVAPVTLVSGSAAGAGTNGSSAGATPVDGDWFNREVHAHDGQLKSFLRGYYPAVRDVEDVVQESYIRVWKAAASQPIRSAKNFLFQVASRLALDWLKHERASPCEQVAEIDHLAVPEDARDSAELACTNEEIEILAEAVESLPGRCREIIVLRKIQGLSQKEIARRLKISEQTVEAQVQRGMKRCERLLYRRGIRGLS